MILVLIDLLPVLSASPQKAGSSGSLQCTVTRPRNDDDDYDRHDDDDD